MGHEPGMGQEPGMVQEPGSGRGHLDRVMDMVRYRVQGGGKILQNTGKVQ